MIPTGVDVELLRALEPIDTRTEARWPADSFVAVAVGRLAPEKSPMVVLNAIATAARAQPELRMVVIGGGPSDAELRMRADEADLRGRIWFTGSLPRPLALSRAAGGDVFVFASRTETQGLVLAEALAVGLPVVAVDGPGVRDTIRDGVDGTIVPAEPAASRAARLGEAVATLAADVALRRRLARDARIGADRFSLGRRAEEIEALYERLRG